MPHYHFQTLLLKYADKGEKTGWTYVEIPEDIIPSLKLKDRRGFRIKGSIDNVRFEKLSTYPVKGAGFIIALNATLRKKIGKKEGAMVAVKFELDSAPPLESAELKACLKEDPEALERFNSLLPSHQNYHHRYVESAKGAATKAGRIVNILNALHKGQSYGEMIRSLKEK